MESQMKKIDKFSFSLKDCIGQGSFGKVFKGKNELTGEVVAVKMIDKQMIQNDEYLHQGLFQEINVMKCLKSKNIVQLLDVLETNNNYYIIQEFCDGGDFRGVLKKRKFIPESEALKVLVDILNGFIDLLDHGIIHRDLKPENILIHQETFKLADFGFARTVDNFKRQMLTSLVGTPLYMSPQILKHERYTTKSDIWSIALIYYEMLVGKTPWTARSQYELVQNISNKPIEFPSDRVISQKSKNFILSCLQIEEGNRIDWYEIYQHPVFEGCFDQMVKKSEKLENTAQFIINQLRQQVLLSGMDLQEIFQKFQLNSESKIEINGFSELMKKIDKTLSRQEIEYIFNKFDADGDNSVDFEEFKAWLEKHNIRLSTKQNIQNKSNSNEIDGNLNPQQEIKKLSSQNYKNSQEILSNEQKALKSILMLQRAIEKFSINLMKLFQKFDYSKDGYLEEKEFAQMIQRIDKNLTDDEIHCAFKLFDVNGDGKISYSQFVETLNKNLQNSNQTTPQLLATNQ